jgi:hypothetical protein
MFVQATLIQGRFGNEQGTPFHRGNRRVRKQTLFVTVRLVRQPCRVRTGFWNFFVES